MTKFLITGLGNIGEEYFNTRHNIGFIILDALAIKREITFTASRYGSIAKFNYKGRTFILLKPSTYMNASGKAIRYWLEKEKIETCNLLVVTDDISLPLGSLRMRKKGADGGHNGLCDICEVLGHNEFARLRVGIGNEFPKGQQIDYVLGKWTSEEEKTLIPRIETAVEMIISFGTIGIDRTMNAYNKK